MGNPSRRALLAGAAAGVVGMAWRLPGAAAQSDDADSLYASIEGEPFPVPAINLGRINARYLRQIVPYDTAEEPGTIIIDPAERFLYYTNGDGQAVRYGVGVGRQGFGWSGVAAVHNKQQWPDWYPPKEMMERDPKIMAEMSKLQSGLGMHGGPGNPLGARAMYLWQGNHDTYYRIHGTVEPWTIGTSVSSGCIRMINQDVMDLYERVPVGTKVIVLGSVGMPTAERAPPRRHASRSADAGGRRAVSPDPATLPADQ